MSSKKEFYVYRITNILENKHYYGFRKSKNPENDLGVNYFSSSSDEEFIRNQKETPENFKYKIIRKFETKSEALSFEILLHNKFNVGVNESFYNRAKQTSVGFSFSFKGLKRPKHSKIMTGRKHSLETKRKIGLVLKGKSPSLKARKLCSERNKLKVGEKNPFFGKTHSKETKRKISEIQKKRKREKHSLETKRKIGEKHKNTLQCINITDKNNIFFERVSTHDFKNNEYLVSTSSNVIMIFNELDEIQYTFFGNFFEEAKKLNLPISAFLNSYSENGKKIYQNSIVGKPLTVILENGWFQYKGWYAIRKKVKDYVN